MGFLPPVQDCTSYRLPLTHNEIRMNGSGYTTRDEEKKTLDSFFPSRGQPAGLTHPAHIGRQVGIPATATRPLKPPSVVRNKRLFHKFAITVPRVELIAGEP